MSLRGATKERRRNPVFNSIYMDSDILLIDKPKGITSFDVIRRLRKQMDIRKMGHAGTLDPLATGLMIIGVEKGTKKLNDFIKLDKVYEVEVLLGVQTDSGDLEGKILKTKEVKEIDETKVKKVVEGLVGKITLPVPIFSAIKRDGEALYKKARRGEKVDPPKKDMEIYSAEILGCNPKSTLSSRPERSGVERSLDTTNFAKDTFSSVQNNNKSYYSINLRLKVSSGTYIRSIAEEIGRQLDLPATVKELRRTQIGDFKVEQAKQLDN